jgi:hypothetical protein
MNTHHDPVFSEDPPGFMLKNLTVRIVAPHERGRANELLKRDHYLGELPQGSMLMQAVEHDGRWVALLDWGPAAHRLADRDEWIGWTARQRAERLPLGVMNRRFCILGNTRMPNLASRSLGLAVAALPEHWEQLHGFRPLFAETFTDIEAYEGTCYKAAGWVPIGHTKGFGRHRADYYQHHGRIKKLWIKTLNRNTRRILTAMDLPAAYRKAVNKQTPERSLPLKKGQCDSLRDWMRQRVVDPRAENRKFPLSSLLAFIAMALLAGRKNLAEIQRYGQFLTPAQRRWLDWPLKKGTRVRVAPSYKALYNLLGKLDPHAFAEAMTSWLQHHHGRLPRALAVDGKWVRDSVLTVCLSDHETGAPVAVGIAAQKPRTEENKREGEQTVALRLYEQIDLENATVTGDANFDNQSQARSLGRKGADYLFQLKDPNRHAYQRACQKADTTPFLPTSKSPNAGMADSTNAP